MLLYIILVTLTIPLPQSPSIWNDPNALALMSIGAGILGAIATFGATVYTVRQGRTKRRITYQVISNTPIVTVDSTVSGKVQVLFNGQPAEEARVLVLEVRNTGNSSIRKDDYFEPLIISFETDVISADVLKTEPPTLLNQQIRNNFLTLGKQSIQLLPFPLNRRDTITLTILLKGTSAIRVEGRLDQGTISNLSPDKRFFSSQTITLLVVLLFELLTMVALMLLGVMPTNVVLTTAVVIVILIILGVILAASVAKK